MLRQQKSKQKTKFLASAAVDPGGYGVSWSDEIDISAKELWAHGIPLKSAL